MYNDWLSIGKFTIHGYGVMIAIGFALAIYVSYFRAKKKGMNYDVIPDIAIIAMIGGFLGAKILYIIVEFKAFLQDPLSVIGLAGFVVYGGIVAAVGLSALWLKHKKLNFLDYFDLVMPQVALAQGFGRLGCFFAGCCYGAQTDSFLGIVFPKGCCAPAGVKLWPTQLFSSGGDFVIALILYICSAKRKKKGDIGALYLILYGIGRFIVEFFRNDPRGAVGALSTSQFISIFIVIAGIVFMVILRLIDKKKTGESAEEVKNEAAAENEEKTPEESAESDEEKETAESGEEKETAESGEDDK